MAVAPRLHSAFPATAQLPWVSLGNFPTAVERVVGLVADSVELWCKRDDRSGTLYGGNKVRKLEFLLGDAEARAVKRVVTVGGIGSHHVLATAIYARQRGLGSDAVVFPQPLNDHVREQLLCDAACGTRLYPTRGYLGVPLALWRARRPPDSLFIAAGGSSPLGTLGYVDAGLELRAQIAAGELPCPDVIYVALGSGGTVAGLSLGLGDLPTQIVAVRVVERIAANAWRTRRLAQKTVRLLGTSTKAAPFTVAHAQFGGRYGQSTKAAEAAVDQAATVGLRCETTYTGKVMAQLLADAASGRLDGKRVLFWHTYSAVDLQPLLGEAPPVSALPPLLQRHFRQLPPPT